MPSFRTKTSTSLDDHFVPTNSAETAYSYLRIAVSVEDALYEILRTYPSPPSDRHYVRLAARDAGSETLPIRDGMFVPSHSADLSVTDDAGTHRTW